MISAIVEAVDILIRVLPAIVTAGLLGLLIRKEIVRIQRPANVDSRMRSLDAAILPFLGAFTLLVLVRVLGMAGLF